MSDFVDRAVEELSGAASGAVDEFSSDVDGDVDEI